MALPLHLAGLLLVDQVASSVRDRGLRWRALGGSAFSTRRILEPPTRSSSQTMNVYINPH